jgi:hypothetical protein
MAPWSRRDVHLVRLLQRAARDRLLSIELTAADEAELARESRDPPRLFDVIAVPVAIAAASVEAVRTGDVSIRILTPDVPGTRMLGRFCHGSPAITAMTRELIALEEARRPEAVFAEIVHLPEGRIGNVLLRPALRGHEIPFLGRSGIAPAQQISVDDLVVSIKGNRIVLRSQRLGREIVPRLTSAHNFTRFSLGVYRFLAALAQQDGTHLGFSWGGLADAPFQPRITSGRVVLSRACWVLNTPELGPIKDAAKRGRAGLLEAIARLRASLELPRWIVLADQDNELVVDLENDVKFLPDFVAGDRSIMVAAGTVDAKVDFSGLTEKNIVVSADRKMVVVHLPTPVLADPRIDNERTQVVARQRGVLTRIGGVFSDQPVNDQKLYVLAEEKLRAAAEASQLRDLAQKNTQAMLEALLRSLGFEQITVIFDPPVVAG